MKQLVCVLLVLLSVSLLVTCQGSDSGRSGQGANVTGMAPTTTKVCVRTDGHPYANFCQVTGTPEEVILDFGLNPQPFGEPRDGVEVDQRVVINFYTAKRLLAALEHTVQKHEEAYGTLELDPRKRVKK